jgi:hypothetical protein
MINNVRKTVLSVLNKNNYGYISPDDFNMYARQAQLEVFESYFYSFNKAVNFTNQRVAGTDYADLVEKIEQDIDVFHVTKALTVDPSGGYYAPSLITTGDEAYMVMGLDLLDTGVFRGEATRISNSKIRPLVASNLTAPSYSSAVYTENAGTYVTYPSTTGVGDCEARYIRYPSEPKWTYLSFGNGEPLFNGSATDFQDFEVSPSEETELINKILQMAGMSIRDLEIVKTANTEEEQRKTNKIK